MQFNSKRSEWLRAKLQSKRLTHIVDVGANPIEEVAYQDLMNVGGCVLTGFEPQKLAFDKLIAAKKDNETYHNCAVGAGGQRPLYITRHDSMTSFFREDKNATRYLGRFGQAMEITETVDLQTVALDDVADLGQIDLLKIDIQGGELDVFQGATKQLEGAIAVIPEVRFYPLYQDEPMMSGVEDHLRRIGFALHKFLFAKALILPTSQFARMKPSMHHNQLIDGDAVYIRDLAYPDSYSDEQLKHLAILSDGVWFSFDLVVRCLDLLVARGAILKDVPSQYVDRLPEKMLRQN